MKHTTSIVALCILFCSAFVPGRGQQEVSACADSLRGVFLYTEGIKQNLIFGDTTRATQLFEEAIAADSTLAPAYFELATALLQSDTPRAITLSQHATALDSTNKWYLELLGQTLITGERYNEALPVYQRLNHADAQNPDTYRMLAALYELAQQPFSAISVLDSAETRFGRIPLLCDAKRRLLVATRQYDKAIAEVAAQVAETPYEAENHVALAELYNIMGRDSLARVEFATAIRIDSTDITTLVSMADFYNRHQEYRAFLGITKRLFTLDSLPVEQKVNQFKRMTSDSHFYRENFLQLHELASLLAIKYPNNQQVIDLYGRHLIASGELEQALALYKHHTTDRPAVKGFFTMVIDIESYKQQTDSVEKYVAQAIRLFPDTPDFYISRGHVHSYAKHYDEAVKSYKTSLHHAPTDSLRGLIWGYIGDTYHAASEQKKCYKAYDKSLRYYRDNAMVLNNYAFFLAEDGRLLDQALIMAKLATSLTQNNPTYLDTHAWVLFKLGRIAEAKKIMQLAISLDRDNSPDLQLHYGDILAAGEEWFMAEVYWRKALENGYAPSEVIQQRFEWLKMPKPAKTDGQ
ncbi:MAG: hypothetical protein RR318_06755 [Alistipes sp.]